MASCLNSAAKKKAKCESTTNPNWLDLPTDLTVLILQKLDVFTILERARNVCSLWKNICNDPLIWRTHTIHLTYDTWRGINESRYMLRYVIDQSCGLLEDVHIDNGDYDLLIYMADRASNLRRLSLKECFGITDEGLIKVAKKLPLLEELDISTTFFNDLSKHSLEVIGKCCPLLKSLVFIGSKKYFLGNDGDAFAIANTMPKLRRLRIVGNQLTISGFNAIINGCPLLESLDLRECCHLTVSGIQKQKCQERIKDLKLPTNYSKPSDDYYNLDWDTDLIRYFFGI